MVGWLVSLGQSLMMGKTTFWRVPAMMSVFALVRGLTLQHTLSVRRCGTHVLNARTRTQRSAMLPPIGGITWIGGNGRASCGKNRVFSIIVGVSGRM